ncbi:unnamed protein product [Symbiodinium sp. KB8]|nr:unnamed protein product [Symbiodinium sp. KB8]
MALQVLCYSLGNGIEADVISYSAAISACEEEAQWQAALQLLQDLRSSYLVANVVALTAAISACTKGRNWQSAIALFAELRAAALQPNIASYDAVLLALDESARFEEALSLFEELKTVSIEADSFLYRCMLNLSERAGDGVFARSCLRDLENMAWHAVPGELPGDPLWHIRADDCEIIEPVQAINACADELGAKNDKSPGGKSPPPGSPKKISVKDYKRQNSRWIDDEESEDSPIFLLMLDVVPAVVIMISAVVAGLSADLDDEHSNIVWEVLEIFFTAFFVGEILIKMRVFGLREFLMGGDWYWSWFDILCVVLAFVDLAVTYTTPASQDSDSASLGTLKMLKLARLGRIIRLLKFKIFQELKLMIQGVFTGLRVLTWAVILLLVSMYLLGVITRTLLGQHPEFRDVPSAMFTSFRCVTDGCTAYDGTPLIARLRTEEKDLGGVIMIVYILLFLFVTIGIFNLIMAVFIDNVTDGSTKKRQRQLGANAPKTEWLISSVLRNIILTKILHKEAEEEAWNDDYHAHGRRPSKILKEKLAALQEMYGYKPHTIHEYEQLSNEIRKEMARRNVVVTREEFNHWLSGEKELITTLDDSEIDLSCKSDLFDVLDADLSGELEFEEMIDGLLKCRGPASKTDIIAVRLKTALLVKLLTQVLSGIIKDCGRSHQWTSAVYLLQEARARDWQPNCFVHGAAISACAHARRWEQAVQLLADMREDRLDSNIILVSAAINACSHAGCWEQAVQLLAGLGEDRLDANIILVSAAVSACEKGGAWQTALQLLGDLTHSRIDSDVIIINAAISACEKGEQWTQALSLLAGLHTAQLEPDVISYNAAISACGRCEKWCLAVGLLCDLRECRLQASTITCNAVISACGQSQEWQRAMNFLQDVEEQRLEASTVTMSAAISACEAGGQWRIALQLLEDMTSSRLEANIVAYNAAVSACGIAGQWEQSLAFLDLLPQRSLQPDIYTYSAAISALSDGEQWDPQWEQALHLFDELSDLKLLPNIVTFGATVTACEKGGQWQAALCLLEDVWVQADIDRKQWQRALGLLDELRRNGYRADVISFSAAIRACEDDARWPQALCLFEDCWEIVNFTPWTRLMLGRLRPSKWATARDMFAATAGCRRATTTNWKAPTTPSAARRPVNCGPVVLAMWQTPSMLEMWAARTSSAATRPAQASHAQPSSRCPRKSLKLLGTRRRRGNATSGPLLPSLGRDCQERLSNALLAIRAFPRGSAAGITLLTSFANMLADGREEDVRVHGRGLMTACHAVAHRLLLESLGLVRPPTATAVTLPCLSPPAQLDMAPCFAGLLAGPSAEVLRALRHLLAVLPSVGLRFSSLVVAAAAGPHHQINFDPFLEAGCSSSGAGDLEVLKSPIGSETFCADFSRKLVDKQLVAVHAVGQLPDAQVGYYLFRCSCCATLAAPLRPVIVSTLHALGRFDTGVQAAFQDLVGGGLEPLALGTGHVACEGRWPRPTVCAADSAYVGSHNCTFERCRALWGDYVWDADQPGLDAARRRPADVLVQPIVLESHGGYSRAAASLLHRLADVVASAEGPFGPNPSMKQAPMEGQEGRRKLDFAFVTEEVFSKDKAGECNGPPRRKAGKTSCEDLRPSDSDRLRVHKIADWLLERNFAVTPANVARRMGADRIGREDIRAILKHRRTVEDEKSTKKFRESWEDIQQVAEKFQDPDSGPLFIQDICMEAFTYIAFLPLMLNALQNLLSEAAGEYNSKWAMCADFTHSMCVMGFKYVVICAVIHRRLKGRWRRSFWPLIIACSPVETLLSYEKIFTALCDELQRLNLLASLALLPTQLMFHLITDSTLKRITGIWNEQRFAEYLLDTYLRKRPPPENSGLESEVYDASWWHGLAFRLMPGHPPTQQCAEGANAKIKRDVQAGGVVLDTHGTVIEEIAQAATLWASPLKVKDGDKPLTLLAGREALATHMPRGPDSWMLRTKGLRLRRPFGQLELFPSIPTLLKFWQVRTAIYIRESPAGGTFRWACVASHKPIPVPPGQLEKMRAMIQERKAAGLLQKLKQAHILQDEDHETANLKFDKESYDDCFSKFSLLWIKEGDARVKCSCWLHRWSGHCPHSYALEQRWQLSEHWQPPLPSAKQAARQARGADSGDEQNPRAIGSDRKRRR